MTRRTFIEAVASGIAAFAVDPVYVVDNGLAEEERATLEGYEWVNDPYPMRLMWTGNGWERVEAFKYDGEIAGINREWHDAPYELRAYVKVTDDVPDFRVIVEPVTLTPLCPTPQ